MTVKEAKAQRATIQQMRSVLSAASRRAYRHGDTRHSEMCAEVEKQAMYLQIQILAEMPYQQNGMYRGTWRR